MLVTMEGCDLDVDRGPGWLFVRLHGHDGEMPDFDGLADRIWTLLERHLTYRVVLELDELDVVPSQLIAELVELHRRVEGHEGVIRLSGLSPHSRKLLLSWRLSDRLPVYGDRVAAVMGTPGQPR